jgi:hypothetical protein
MLTKLKEIAARITVGIYFVEDGVDYSDPNVAPVPFNNPTDLIKALLNITNVFEEHNECVALLDPAADPDIDTAFDWEDTVNEVLIASAYCIADDYEKLYAEDFFYSSVDTYNAVLHGLREAVALERQNQIQKTLPNPEATQ